MKAEVARYGRDQFMRRVMQQAVCLAILNASVAWGNLSIPTRVLAAPRDPLCLCAPHSGMDRFHGEPKWPSADLAINTACCTSLLGSSASIDPMLRVVGWEKTRLSNGTCSIPEPKTVYNVPPPPKSSALVLSGILSLGMWRCVCQAKALLNCVIAERTSLAKVRCEELRVTATLVGTECAGGGQWQWRTGTKKERDYRSRLQVGKDARAPPVSSAAPRRIP